MSGESAELTPTEFRLLYALALEHGRVVTRDELLQKVWGRRLTHRDRTVDVFVRKIRDKLESSGPRTRSSRRATASATSSKRSRSSGRRRPPLRSPGAGDRQPHVPGAAEGGAGRDDRRGGAAHGRPRRRRGARHEGDRLEGILTERDILNAVAVGLTRARASATG